MRIAKREYVSRREEEAQMRLEIKKEREVRWRAKKEKEECQGMGSKGNPCSPLST